MFNADGYAGNEATPKFGDEGGENPPTVRISINSNTDDYIITAIKIYWEYTDNFADED